MTIILFQAGIIWCKAQHMISLRTRPLASLHGRGGMVWARTYIRVVPR